jgi:Rrf2 family protein
MAGIVRISEAVSIGIHATLGMSLDASRYWSVREIGAHYGFSTAHMAKVMRSLARAGIITAVRGPHGGARLKLPPEKITLLSIYEAIDGSMEVERCLLLPEVCRSRCCRLGIKLAGHNQAIRELFATTTIASLAQSLEKPRKKA